jgi:hypothetical protein
MFTTSFCGICFRAVSPHWRCHSECRGATEGSPANASLLIAVSRLLGNDDCGRGAYMLQLLINIPRGSSPKSWAQNDSYLSMFPLPESVLTGHGSKERGAIFAPLGISEPASTPPLAAAQELPRLPVLGDGRREAAPANRPSRWQSHTPNWRTVRLPGDGEQS